MDQKLYHDTHSQYQKISNVHTFLHRLSSIEIEKRGIDRIPDDERLPKHSITLLMLWLGFNTVIATVTVGMLAQSAFDLTLAHAAAIIVGFSIIGCATIGFIATLGPQLGMRTMILTRYSYGYWGASAIAFLSLITQLGFSVIIVILAAQILHDVNHNFPLVVGIIIIGLISFTVCFIGYNLLHCYERYAWLLVAIIYIIIAALGGHEGYQPSLQIPLERPPGRLRAAAVLSFGSIIFSTCASWTTIAADYTCRLPTHFSAAKVFFMTFWGNFIPIVLTTTLGAALMTVPVYAAAYKDADAAGLLRKVFEPWGRGGDFLLVLLALSAVANNIPCTYSTALSMQTLIPPFRRIPRAFFTLLAFIIYTAAALAGREHFSIILSNFLSVLGYWIGFWFIVILEEHFIFRRRGGMLGGYDVEVYNTPSLLPIGIAAIVSSLFGVGGAVISMAETWYIGPVAAKLGPDGGDIGFEFAVGCTGLVYPVLRWAEVRMFGK